ncbi:MAG: DUF2834 domain-containing protein [Aquabacterium sp.]|nr:MAG: DUF2834 domain-containing protein [Aquabacterium sp.]
MKISRKALCLAYGLLAVLALVGTWGNNVQYLSLGFLGANLRFWQDTLANPASRSITVDVLFLFVAVSIWMFLEARRLGMRGAWLYVILGVFIAISVTFPLFLLNRERALQRQGGEAKGGQLGTVEIAGLLLFALVGCAYTVAALSR